MPCAIEHIIFSGNWTFLHSYKYFSVRLLFFTLHVLVQCNGNPPFPDLDTKSTAEPPKLGQPATQATHATQATLGLGKQLTETG